MPFFVPSTSPFDSPSLLPAVSTSTRAAGFSSTPNASPTHPKVILRLRMPWASIGAFRGMDMSFLLSLTWFHCPGRFTVSVSSLGGKFRVFNFNWWILTFFLALVAVFTFIATLCMPARVLDASALFPRPSIPPMLQFSGPIGELGDFILSGVIPMTLGVLAVDFALLLSLRACVHPLDASAQFLGLCDPSGRGSRLVPGKSDFVQQFLGFLTLSDWFSGILELFATFCMCSTHLICFRVFWAQSRTVLRL